MRYCSKRVPSFRVSEASSIELSASMVSAACRPISAEPAQGAFGPKGPHIHKGVVSEIPLSLGPQSPNVRSLCLGGLWGPQVIVPRK